METFDVMVLGTGAAGLIAALATADRGTSVGVFEKNNLIGGTTAISGGIAWIPINPHAAKKGVNDTRDSRATLGPIDKLLYYAARIESSALGTKGGPKIDVNAAVLGHDGTVIPGLYAAGNAMSGPTGMVYGGAGGTIGPAMIFGFIAGNHAAQNISQAQKAAAA